MAQHLINNQPFLGREHFDERTMMYSFKDGSGAVPEEMRQDLFDAIEDKDAVGHNGLSVLAVLFAWKQRLSLK